jgi:putative colanic acid biosynthesis acetyltransferase WcaF
LPLVPSPRLGNRLARVAWGGAWLLLFRPSPTPLHGWRRFLLRCFGARIGPRAHPYPSARVWAPWNLTMEEGSCLGLQVEVYNVVPVHLGRWSIVSQRAYLCTASHDIRNPGFRLTGAPIRIGEHAWIAASAFVGPGVTVGNGAIAGACAVVTRDVPPRGIVAGNPAAIMGETGPAFAGGEGAAA